MDKVVFEFAKSDTEVIRARISDFTGEARADIRVFFKAADGEWRPTKRGINVPLALVDSLQKAVGSLTQSPVKA